MRIVYGDFVMKRLYKMSEECENNEFFGVFKKF